MENSNVDEIHLRPKREKAQKSGRLAALEALRQSKRKGEKHKYEPQQSYEPLYDVIDEAEYSEKVRERQDDEFVVNDDGFGYVDDGREIFDDDYSDGEDIGDPNQKTGKKSNRFKSKNPNVGTSGKATKDLKTFFASSGTSKKPESITAVDDVNLLSEVISGFSSSVKKTSKTTILLNDRKKIVGTFVPKAPSSSNGNPFSKQPKGLKRLQESPAKSVSPVKPPKKLSKPSNSPLKPHTSTTGTGRMLFPDSCPDSGIDSCPTEDEMVEQISQFETQQPDANQSTIDEFETQAAPSLNFNIDVDDFKDINLDEFDVKTEIKEPASMKSNKIVLQEANFSEEIRKVDEEMVGICEPAASITNFSELKLDDNNEISSLLSTNEDCKRVLRFYLLDSFDDAAKNPGTVFLFGRVLHEKKKVYFSCSVIVKNVWRRLWFLPKEYRVHKKTGEAYGDQLQISDVYNEITLIADKHGIPEFKIKKVFKKFSIVGTLDADAPAETEYLEMRYPFSDSTIPSDLQGETFSAIFGCSSSAMELFLLEQKIKGPRWLEIVDPCAQNPPITWCSAEFLVEKPSFVRPSNDTAAPPVHAMILNFKTVQNSKNQSEIVAAGIWSQSSFDFDKDKPSEKQWQHLCVLTKSSDSAFPFDFKNKLAQQSITTVEVVGNERALINFILTKLQKIDPDIIIGHDLWNFELELFMQRIVANKVPNWSRIGRLRRSAGPKLQTHKSGLHEVTVGRLICDVALMAREMIKSKHYDLTGLVSQVLNHHRVEILPEHVKSMYNSSEKLLELIKYVKLDCFWTLQLVSKLQCLPLASEITRIVGGVLSKTLMGGRAERTEFLLLHALEAAGYIYPDKVNPFKKRTAAILDFARDEDDNQEDGAAISSKKKAAYAGGLVLEPKKGLYDQLVLLLDFNSLYPSIIQEFNICFTTINLTHGAKTESEDEVLPDIPNASVDVGILPSEIRKLVDSRRVVKNLMKDAKASPEQLQQYNIRQQALKITANSMYGCLGFGSSRFYAKPLAALITSKGREILTDTKDLVENLGLEVIYGDTDSIMINTNCFEFDEALTVAKKVKTEVNKKYRLLELEMDGMYKKLLLLKKKKYAGLSIERQPDNSFVFKKEIKGLDIVRRDWSLISVEAGDYVLDEILSDKGVDEILEHIHQYLTDLGESVRNDKIDYTKYLINKQLTKAPSEYTDKKSLPHVTVAFRLNKEKSRHFKQGDVVSYIICEDGTNNTATQRAYDLCELNDGDKHLKIDINYYLSQQIHPVVTRLCEPIEATDGARIAECLGLDSSSYRRHAATASAEQDDDWSSLVNPALDYSRCEPFSFVCFNPNCNAQCEIRSTFVGNLSNIEFSLARCSNADCKDNPFNQSKLLANSLRMKICQLISRYYSNWMVCDDITCAHRTRRVTFRLDNGRVKCPACRTSVMRQQMTEKCLYAQLSFYRSIFDLDDAVSRLSKEEREIVMKSYNACNEAYKELHRVVDHFLKCNSYSQIDLGKLFQGLRF